MRLLTGGYLPCASRYRELRVDTTSLGAGLFQFCCRRNGYSVILQVRVFFLCGKEVGGIHLQPNYFSFS